MRICCSTVGYLLLLACSSFVAQGDDGFVTGKVCYVPGPPCHLGLAFDTCSPSREIYIGGQVKGEVLDGKWSKEGEEFKLRVPYDDRNSFEVLGELLETCKDLARGVEVEITYFGTQTVDPGIDPGKTLSLKVELRLTKMRHTDLADPSSGAIPTVLVRLAAVRERVLRPAIYRPSNSRATWVQAAALPDPDSTKEYGLEVMVCSLKDGDEDTGKCGNRTPIAGASVTLFDRRSRFTLKDFSDERGMFKVADVLKADRSYILSVSADRHEPASYIVFSGPKGSGILNAVGKAVSGVVLRETTPALREEDWERVLRQGQPSRSARLDNTMVDALPLGRIRSIDNLALLVAGVAPAPQSFGPRGPGVAPGLGTAGQFAVNGLSARQNNFTLDGADNNDEDVGVRRQGFLSSFSQSIESISDFHIITAVPDARYGRAIGAQVNIVSKQGNLGVHGAIYGFLSDSRLRAHGPFDAVRPEGLAPITASGVPVKFDLAREHPLIRVDPGSGFGAQVSPATGKNPFTSTQAGFALGGPIKSLLRKAGAPRRLAGIGHQRTYAYLSYERLAQRAAEESHFATPTIPERGFLGCGASGFTFSRSRDSFARCAAGPPSPFDDSFFPASQAGAAVFSLFPFPNNPNEPYGENTYTNELSSDATSHITSLKLDRRFGDWIGTGRYHFTRDNVWLPSVGGATFSTIRPEIQNQNVVGTLSGNIRGVANYFRFAYGRTIGRFQPRPGSTLLPSERFPDERFLLNAPLLINASTHSGPRFEGPMTNTEQVIGPVGRVNIAGFSPVGLDTFHFPQRRRQSTFQFSDTLTWIKPKQTLYWGIDSRLRQFKNDVRRNTRPELVFGGLDSVGLLGQDRRFVANPTDLVSAGLPMGLLQTFAPAETVDSRDGYALRLRKSRIESFVQHEWRPHDRFRIHLGLRFAYSRLPAALSPRFEDAFNPELIGRLAEEARSSLCVDTRTGPNSSEGDANCMPRVNTVESLFGGEGVAERLGADGFDFGPRFGFAWNPDKNGHWAIRLGIARISAEFPGVVLNESRSVFPHFLSVNRAAASSESGLLLDPNRLSVIDLSQSVPNLVALIADSEALRGSLLSVTQPETEFGNPYANHLALTIDRRLGAKYMLSLAYVATQGRKLLRVATPDGGILDARIPNIQVTGESGGLPLFGVRSLFSVGNTDPRTSTTALSLGLHRTNFEGRGKSDYHSFQLEIRRRYARHLHLRSALTVGEARDDASDFFDTLGSYALPESSGQSLEDRVRAERGPSSFDVRTRLVTSAVWKVPEIFDTPWLKKWRVSGIYTMQSGQPFTVNSVFDLNRDGNLTDRPPRSIVFEPSTGSDPRLLLATRGSADAVRETGPSIGRNSFRAPGIHNLDIAIDRSFDLTDDLTLRLRLEGYNVLNRNHFGIPARLLEGPGFGRAVNSIVEPRTLQFAIKAIF